MKAILIITSLTLSAAAGAATLDLSRVPPNINASVPPNMMVSLDDSGSMGFGYMPTSYSAGSCQYYDSSTNAVYYNPNITYEPPLNPDGSPMANASFTAAWWDGFRHDVNGDGTADRSNLATAYRVSHDHNGHQQYEDGWRTSGFPSGVSESCGRNCTNQRAFYCANGNVVIIGSDPAQRQSFANWFSYYRTRSLAARSALTTAFAKVDGSIRVAWQNFNTNHIQASTEIRSLVTGNPDDPASVDTSWRTSFYNWLRTPRFSGGTPMITSFHRAGEFFTRNSTNNRNPYWDSGYGRELSCRQNYHIMMTDGQWNGAVSSGASAVGNYDNPGRTIHDGNALTGPAARIYHNVAAGGSSVNLADLAMYYWARDLRTNLDNNVPKFIGDRATGVITGATTDQEIYFNPANDPADWQHLVNFMVTFGAGGTLNSKNPAVLTGLRRGSIQWPAASNDTAATIDDAWHAAVNSRGAFLSADNPQELVNAMSSILDNISRRQGTVGAVGSTSFLRSDAAVYQASYDTGRWGGDVIALQVDDNGNPTEVLLWDSSAADQLNDRPYANRRIITNTAASGPATQVAFQWGNLNAQQRAWLNRNPVTNVVDNLGEQRVNWIRGERSREQQNGGTLRNRDLLLGPIINSSLIRVEAPRFGYRGRIGFREGGQAYQEFRNAHSRRSPTLYVGANDGMLHAFNSDTGEERWAFIPGKVSRNLARLTVPDYQFVPFVNNTPIDHDVFIRGAWRTVLIGTLGLGGQGIYAIDITDPDAPRVLWEITDEEYPLLGYTYGRPNTYRLSDGTWIALVPSGYNSEARIDYSTRNLPNEQPDAHYVNGGDSNGAVFAINIATGAAKTIVVPGSRGLATLQLADKQLDYKLDFAVAGDLHGNIYRIDFEGLGWDNLGSALVDRMFNGSSDRPITAGPTIFSDPTTGHMTVVVGTGKYLEDHDRETEIPRQAIYGVRECGARCPDYPLDLSDLIEQRVVVGADGRIRMARTNLIPADKSGWFIQLGNPSAAAVAGERVLEMAIPISFSSNIVGVVSYIPSDEPCSPQGTSAIYVLSALTGGFVFPGPGDGTSTGPGDPIIDDPTCPECIGLVSETGGGSSAFINPDDGRMSIMGVTINGVPIRRRSGWREIPVQ